MKLKGKILALSLVPVIALGVLMFLVAADRIANGTKLMLVCRQRLWQSVIFLRRATVAHIIWTKTDFYGKAIR